MDDHPCYVQRWGLGVGVGWRRRGGLPMSPEDVHIRVIRLGHAIQAGFRFFGWISGTTGLNKVGSTSGKHINWLVVSNIGEMYGVMMVNDD